jgi:hypothetical protein
VRNSFRLTRIQPHASIWDEAFERFSALGHPTEAVAR